MLDRSSTAPDAAYWIDKLQLTPHPEGGFFRQTYRAELQLDHSALPETFHGARSACTAIYFLLAGDDVSVFHRIASDELWHFYAGSGLSIHVIETDGRLSEIRLGPNPDEGEAFQALAPAGCWFASCLTQPAGFALVGCTVSPGFDFADFEIADRAALLANYPQHQKLIHRLTRTPG